MDKVFIKGLRVKAHIGIYEWEQQIEQSVLIDLEMSTDAVKAASADDIKATINYRVVADRIKELIASRKFQLVETLAEQIAQLVKTEFGVKWLRVTVSKPTAFADADAVGVTIER